MTKKPTRRTKGLGGAVDYVRKNMLTAIGTLIVIGSFVGMLFAVDGFYVRSTRYEGDRVSNEKQRKEDRDQDRRLSLENRLSQEIATLETREAFTRYRLNDASESKKKNSEALQGYRADLRDLKSEIAAKRRQLDQLKMQ